MPQQRLTRFFGAALMFGLASLAVVAAVPAAAQTDVERLYQDLAKLPAVDRQAKLEAGARQEGKLTFIHTLRGKLGRDHIALFERRYPFITVDQGDNGSQEAAEQFVEEERAGRHFTDALSLAIPDLDQLLALKLLASYPTAATSAIFPRFQEFLDPQNRWTPYYWSDFGITYNTNLISAADAPKTWDDLCNPAFRGQVSFDGPNVRFLVGIYKMMGDNKIKSWLQCIGRNKPIIQLGTMQRFELMMAGDHAIQGQNFLYYCPLRKSQNPAAPCAIVLTTPVLGFPGAIVINKYATHPYAAALLADWVLSKESQQYLARGFRGPLALQHPYLPDDVKLVLYGLVSNDIVDKVLRYWDQYVTKAN
jgi:iron(III) transport system substrate-binding protein